MKCENCVRPDPCGGKVNEDGECGLHRTAEEWKREQADTPEPLAAILAEMRDERIIRLDDAVVTRCLLLNLADRIEAAYKRERAEWHAETDAAKEARNRIACRMRYEFAAKCRACKAAPGNAAAMRAILNSIADIAEDAFGGPERHREAAQGHALSLIIDGAKNALAAPARNCDRPECADVESAWATYCAETNRADCREFARWLFALAEGGKE